MAAAAARLYPKVLAFWEEVLAVGYAERAQNQVRFGPNSFIDRSPWSRPVRSAFIKSGKRLQRVQI
jgi:hypothetical protein